jgi:hypothetical protein
LKEYGETVSNFRLLTDIRFKLLAVLPIAAAGAVAVFTATSRADDAESAVRTVVFSAFGLAITVGLATYNARNDQLYDTLVGRAARIERMVDLPDGTFANRPTVWFTAKGLGARWPISHRNSVGLIYAASFALWLFGVMQGLGRLAWQALAETPPTKVVPAWIPAVAMGLAISLVAGGLWAVTRQRKARESAMRAEAWTAVHAAAASNCQMLWMSWRVGIRRRPSRPSSLPRLP